MTKQLFKHVSNVKLAEMIRSQLSEIKINSVKFESRSHINETASICFSFSNIDVDQPLFEIIDDGEFNLDCENGALSSEFVGNDKMISFCVFMAVVLQAQYWVSVQDIKIEGFLTKDYVNAKCEGMGYLLDHTIHPYKPWELYTSYGKLLKGYSSLAELNTMLEHERINVRSF